MIIATRVLNVAALVFTIAASAFLLLILNWPALSAQCLRKDECDILDKAVKSPWDHESWASIAFKGSFLAVASLLALYSAASAALEIRYGGPAPQHVLRNVYSVTLVFHKAAAACPHAAA